MKAGTLFVALVVAGACISGIVWLAGFTGAVDVDAPKPKADINAFEIPETGPFPKAVMPESQHDFGVMAVQTKKSHKFVIKNEGEAPLEYKLKGTSCSCTVIDLELGKIYTVAPGEEAEVEVQWTPPRTDPDFRKEAYIYTNDPENPVISFDINGRVEEMLTIYPEGATWNLTNLERNKPETLHGEIFSGILDKFAITSVETSSAKIQVTYDPIPESELKERGIKSGYRLNVVFTPSDLKVGQIAETVTVHTDLKDFQEIPLTLTGNFLGSITGMPYWPDGESADGRKWVRQLLHTDLGQFPASKGREGWYKLLVNDMQAGEEFEVTGIESSNPYVTASTKPLPTPPKNNGTFHLVTFHVKPGIPPGAYNSKRAVKIILKTNHQYAPEIEFSLSFQAL